MLSREIDENKKKQENIRTAAILEASFCNIVNRDINYGCNERPLTSWLMIVTMVLSDVQFISVLADQRRSDHQADWSIFGGYEINLDAVNWMTKG